MCKSWLGLIPSSSLPPHKCAFIVQHRALWCTWPSSASAKLLKCTIRCGHVRSFFFLSAFPAASNFWCLCGAARLADTTEGDTNAQPCSFCALITSACLHELVKELFSLVWNRGRWLAYLLGFWSVRAVALLGSNRVHGLSMQDAVLKNWIAWVCHTVWWPLPFPPLTNWCLLRGFPPFFFSPPSLPRAFKYKILIRNTDRSGTWSTALHPSQGKSKKEEEQKTLSFSSLCSTLLRLPPFLSERRTWAAGAILLCTEKQLGSILDEWGVH